MLLRTLDLLDRYWTVTSTYLRQCEGRRCQPAESSGHANILQKLSQDSKATAKSTLTQKECINASGSSLEIKLAVSLFSEWKDDLAYIPTNRLHQFLAGEELGGGTTPTKFKIMSSRTRKEGSLQIHRIRPECWLKYTRYWCTFGPKDHRNSSGPEKSGSPESGLAQPTDRSSKGGTGGCVANTRQPTTRGEDFARGCTCHFNVKVMYLWPNITQINYVHRTHTDVSGSICHGSLDPSAVGFKAQFAPRLSMDMRRWVLYLLSRNIPPKQILHQHQQLIQEKRSKNQGYTPVRDDFLNKHDILNISKRLAEESFQMHMSEDESIYIWAQNHQEHVVYHQQQDKDRSTPFVLCIQTPWQKDKLVGLGHQRVVACSATLGTTRFKYQMFTLLVFDMHQNAFPGAWIITSSDRACDMELCLSRLNKNMNEYLSGWKPSCFIVDNPGSEIEAIRSVFEVPVYLCLWRVRRCWLKHLNRKVQNMDVRSAMFRKLGEIMYLSSEQSLSLCNTETHALKQVESFLEDFKEEKVFGSFFRQKWLPKMSLWIKATQNIPHTNLDINSAIEGYHSNLKARLEQGSSRDTILGRRTDWLLHSLVKDVESHFWFIDFSKRWGSSRTATKELVIEPSLLQAGAIPDCNVTLARGVVWRGHGSSSTTSTIVDTNDSAVVYSVHNSDTEWSCCDCEWAKEGNMCKHQVKILIMKGSIGIRMPTQELQSRPDDTESNAQEREMCSTSTVDPKTLLCKASQGMSETLRSIPPSSSQMSSTPSNDFEPGVGNELEIDHDDRFVVEQVMEDKLEGGDCSTSASPSYAKLKESFMALVDSITGIDNVILANYVASIMMQAAHKISNLKEVASECSQDMIFQKHDLQQDSYTTQISSSSSPEQWSRAIVEQVLCRKRKSRSVDIEDVEMQHVSMTLEPKRAWLSQPPFQVREATSAMIEHRQLI